MVHRFVNDCLDCEWNASTDEYSRTELSDRLIEHAVETGHDVTGKRLRNGEDALAGDRHRERDEKGSPEARSPKSDRAVGERRRVYRVNDDFRDGAGDSSDSSDSRGSNSNESANTSRGRTDETADALTRGDFEAELHRLVRRAYRSGVPIEGCEARFPDAEMPDYTIEIHELRDTR